MAVFSTLARPSSDSSEEDSDESDESPEDSGESDESGEDSRARRDIASLVDRDWEQQFNH